MTATTSSSRWSGCHGCGHGSDCGSRRHRAGAGGIGVAVITLVLVVLVGGIVVTVVTHQTRLVQ